jgi:hypothetical protein
MGLQAFVLAISLVDCLSWSGVVSTDCPLKLAAEPCLWPSPRQPNRRTQANMSVSTSGDAPSFDHGSLTGELDDTPSTSGLYAKSWPPWARTPTAKASAKPLPG